MKNYMNDVMMQNINTQPKYFKKILENKKEITNKFISVFESNNIKRIYILGHGSTNYATIAIKYLFTNLMGLDASHNVATIFNNYEGFNKNYKPEEILLICPAATGRTKGPVDAARKAKELGITVLASGTIEDGVLAKESDVFINKLTGKENAYVDVKGHSATLFLYAMCIVEAAFYFGNIDQVTYEKYQDGMEEIIKTHNKIFNESNSWYDRHKNTLLEAKAIKVISYGINYSTAVEGALKISESTQRDALGYDLEQFLHGPNMSSNPEDAFFFVNPIGGREHDRLAKTRDLMMQEGFQKNYYISGVSEYEETESDNNLLLDLVDLEFLSHIQLVIPFQIFAARLAIDLGLDTRVQPESFVNVISVLKTSYTD